MKKVILVMLFCAGSMMVFAQQHNRNKQNVPQAVQHSYQKDYPNYNSNSWDMHNNQWHTRYMDKDHNRNVDVYYDRTGRRVYSQSDWDRNELPVVVKERIHKRYHNDSYKVFRIEKPGRSVYFQITLGNKKVYYDESGREVKF